MHSWHSERSPRERNSNPLVGTSFAVGGTNFKFRECSFATLEVYLKRHYATLFDAKEYLADPRKTLFFEGLADAAMLMDGMTEAGGFLGEQNEWNSYYIRHISIVPMYQNRGLWTAALRKIIDEVGKLGLQALTIDTSCTNHRQIHILNKHGFIIQGLTTSPAWGNLLRFSLIL